MLRLRLLLPVMIGAELASTPRAMREEVGDSFAEQLPKLAIKRGRCSILMEMHVLPVSLVHYGATSEECQLE